MKTNNKSWKIEIIIYQKNDGGNNLSRLSKPPMLTW